MGATQNQILRDRLFERLQKFLTVNGVTYINKTRSTLLNDRVERSVTMK